MSSKCFDDDIVQDPLERSRGHVGVAICCKNKLQNVIEPLPDGGNRVIAIRLNVVQPFILVCVYMPTRGGNATLDDYKAVLDELDGCILDFITFKCLGFYPSMCLDFTTSMCLDFTTPMCLDFTTPMCLRFYHTYVS